MKGSPLHNGASCTAVHGMVVKWGLLIKSGLRSSLIVVKRCKVQNVAKPAALFMSPIVAGTLSG
eukprot:2144153-Amphidinium_carterae.1